MTIQKDIDPRKKGISQCNLEIMYWSWKGSNTMSDLGGRSVVVMVVVVVVMVERTPC